MSKLKRLLGALSLVSLFIFSSCVDDSIAPEVTALRQAQVDLLNADIAYRDAQTALKNAEAEAQSILNAYNSSNNTILLASSQATLDQKLADLQTGLVRAQAELAGQELALQQAQDDLARYLESAGLDEAAFYLANWEVVMFGGAMDADLQDQMGVIGTGNSVIGIQKEIVALQNKIAIAQLFINTGGANDGLTRAYVRARLEIALTDAETALASGTANLATQTAVLAALKADDSFTAIAELEAALIPLFQDSIDALAGIAEAEAALAAAEGVIGSAEATVEDFEERDDLEIWPDPLTDRNRNYRSSKADSALYATLEAAYASDTAVWSVYADSLQAVYDEFYVLYAEGFDATLADLAGDTLRAWEDIQGVDGALIDDNEAAFAEYVIAWNTLVELGNEGLATGGDTSDVVTARSAWDGLNAAQMLPAGSGNGFETEANLFANFGTGLDPTGNVNFVGGMDAYDGAENPAGSGTGVGGTFLDYLDAVGGDANDVFTEAVIRFEEAYFVYFNTVTEFAALQAYINSVKDGSNDDGLYSGSVVALNVDISNLESIDFVADYVARINDINGTIPDQLKDADDFPTFCEVYSSLGLGECPDMEMSGDFGDAATTAKEAFDFQDQAADLYAEALLDLAYAEQIMEPFLANYLAALETLGGDNEAREAYALGLVLPRLAVETATSAYWGVVASQNAIRTQIDDIERLAGTVAVNSDDFTYVNTIEDQIDAVEAIIDGIDIDALEDGVERATNALSTDALETTRLEDLIVVDEAELAAKQAELGILQSIADQLQALLESALAG